MATRYVTLKDSNGDTIYPQSVISQVANGEITTGLLADGAVTSAKIADSAVTKAKIDWSTINKAMLTYQPTTISSNKDLNTAEFCAVGNYCCTTNAVAGTLSNSPTGGIAFKMEVGAFGLSAATDVDITTSEWVTRWRILTDLNCNRWIQKVATGSTPGVIIYGAWRMIGKVFQPGQSISLSSERIYVPGRQRVVSGTKTIEANIVLDGMIGSDVTSITFSPTNYNEAFGPSGTLYSINNPTSSELTYSCSKGPDHQTNTLRMTITVKTSATLTNNAMCLVKPYGTLTFS